MKIVFLNTLNGQIPEIDNFIKKRTKDTEVFCFQEANPHFFNICRKTLDNYRLFFARKVIAQEGTTEDGELPQAIFVKKETQVSFSKELLDGNPKIGFALCIQISDEGKSINICNVHGIPLPGHKLDTQERLDQSKKIIEYYQNVEGAKLIGGDFNLLPQARSIAMFEENGYRDLIKEFGVKTTRNELAWKNYPNNKQYFSDYVFVSTEVKVKKFTVPDIEISDHLPLILEIEV